MPFGIGPAELFVTLVVALVVLAPIAVVFVVLRRIADGRRADPLAILDERLARGEITRDEYLATREAIGR
jgi:uncharacterized membrane protein